MIEVKYVIFQSEGDKPFAVIIPNNVMHSCAFGMIRENDLCGTGNGQNWAKPISAGFVDFNFKNNGDEHVKVFGDSESLSLAARPEDVDIIRTHLEGGQWFLND